MITCGNMSRAKMRRKVIREWLKEYDEKNRFTLDMPIKKHPLSRNLESLEEILKKFNLKYPPKYGGRGNHLSNVMRIKTDDYCAVCGKDFHKMGIIHHIFYPPDAITISVCRSCHGSIHSGYYGKPSFDWISPDYTRENIIRMYLDDWKEYFYMKPLISIWKSLKPKKVSQTILNRRKYQKEYISKNVPFNRKRWMYRWRIEQRLYKNGNVVWMKITEGNKIEKKVYRILL